MHDAVTSALELIAAGIYVDQLIIYAEDLETMSDEDVAQVEQAIRRAGGRSELGSEGDLCIRDVDQSRPMHNYGHLGFGDAVIEALTLAHAGARQADDELRKAAEPLRLIVSLHANHRSSRSSLGSV